MAVTLSPNELERIIEVLSSAGRTFQLTRFETRSYRALLLGADCVLAGFVVMLFVTFAMSAAGPFVLRSVRMSDLWFMAPFFVLALAGMVSLALNTPLLLKTSHEAKRLKRLGLDSLSKSLWKESRRSRWTNRIREVLLTVMGIIVLGLVVLFLLQAVMQTEAITRAPLLGLFFMALYFAIVAVLLSAAGHLQNQRERMDLTSSAEELREVLLSLQRREGPDVISVPAKLLERTAVIESVQISEERTEAVLQGAAFRSKAYTVAFDREAVRQRGMLDFADRVELDDLVAELSTNNAQPEPQPQAIRDTKTVTLVHTTRSKRVNIECVIDYIFRSIHVIAVRTAGDAVDASLNGAGDA
jgi:hypothetical protein